MRARRGRPPSSPWTRVLACCGLLATLLPSAGARAAPSDSFDIGSGGPPTLQGSLNGQVTVANGSLLSDLVVTVDLGEVSPINRNNIVRLVVPIAIRSTKSYDLTVFVSPSGGSGGLLAPQLSDVGLGVQNMQALGKGTRCAAASHRITPPFANDPAVTVNRTGRATYASTVADLGTSRLLMQGPRLSLGAVTPRISDNGWRFDAIFALVPQFFTPGTLSVTLTFRINEAPTNLPCL